MRRAALAALLCAAPSALAGCGASAGPAAQATAAPSPAPRVAVPGGLSLRVPAGWRLRRPPITALSAPTERLLLTSGPAPRGGNCGPDAAESRLPPGGALLYLFEYRSRAGSVWDGLKPSAFPPRPAHARLRARDLGRYECWRVPSYLLRFRAAGRAFQLHVAFGPRATAARRAEVLRAIDSLRVARLAAPKAPPVTAAQLEHALRTNPNEEASAASCRRAGHADRLAARWAFGRTRRSLFVCRIAFPHVAAATYAVVLTPGRCFASASRERRHGDYGCVRPHPGSTERVGR
jgi:hypothetical protein